MSINLFTAPLIRYSNKPKLKLKPKPSPSEAIQARLRILTNCISATEGRTDLTPAKIKKRKKHMAEKAQLERDLAALKIASPSEQTSFKELLTPSLPESLNTLIPVYTPDMGQRSTPTPAAQSTAQTYISMNLIFLPRFELKAEPVSTSSQRSFQPPSSTSWGPSMSLPLRPAPPAWKNRKLPPSAASGGVPEPSKLYLSFTEMDPQAASSPQPLLLVLDLNGTLLYRPDRRKSHFFIERPDTQQFLNYVLAHFRVMIWSSAQPENVELMCNKLFPIESRGRLVAVWGRDRLGLSVADSQRRVQVYKRLERIWNDPEIQAQHPLAHQGRKWHQGNTVLIDDSVEKSRSEPYNFVGVEEFDGKPEDPNILENLAVYLSTLRMQTNVSSYIRRYPLKKLREDVLPTANDVQSMSAQ